MTHTRQKNRPQQASSVQLLLGLLVTGSCSQVAYALHPRKGPFVGYLELGAAAVLAVWAVWVLASRRLKELQWPSWPVAAFLTVGFLSLANATNVKTGGVEVAQYCLYFFGLYTLFINLGAGSGEWLWWGACGSVAIGTLAALGQLLSGAEAMNVRGLAMDRNVHSAFMAFMLPMVWARGCHLWPRKEAIGLFALTGLALITILGPPHVWIAVVAIAWVTSVLARKRFWSFAGTVTCLAIAVNLLSPIHRACNFDELLNPWETGNVYKLLREVGVEEGQGLVKKRWLEWWPALAMIADNPALGVGAGNYQLNIGQPHYWGYLPNAKKTEPNTNNLYLVLGGTLGLGGLAAFLAMMGTHLSLAAARAGDKEALMVGVTGALGALLVANVFTALLVRGACVGWVALMAAAARKA